MPKNFLLMEGGRKGCGVYANAQTGSSASSKVAFRPQAWQGASWDDTIQKLE